MAAATTWASAIAALARLRSRRGFARAKAAGLFNDATATAAAAGQCSHPVSLAFLLPAAVATGATSAAAALMPAQWFSALSAEPFDTPRHRSIVEVVRLAWRKRAVDADQADKQAR